MASTPSADPLYKAGEVAQQLRSHPGSVYKLVSDGKLRAVHVGRKIFIPESSVRDFIAGRTPTSLVASLGSDTAD